MSKLGINIKIDVSKIDKARLFKGNKGVYMDLTTFIDTQVEGKYGDHGFISQSTDKEEREAGVQTPILGNCKVFFVEGGQAAPAQTPITAPTGFDDEIPF
jgi:hypothetical protein